LYAYLYSLSNTEHTHDFSDWQIAKPATCTRDGEKIERCAICGTLGTKTEVIPAIGEHSFAWHTTIEATCTSTGEEQELCSQCGAIGTINPIPKLDCLSHIEILDEKAATIFPNPVHNRLNIESSASGQLNIERIEVVDFTGKIIYTVHSVVDNSIDVSNLSKGVYIIKIYTGDGVIVRRFVKE
jgi:hypothetical protein